MGGAMPECGSGRRGEHFCRQCNQPCDCMATANDGACFMCSACQDEWDDEWEDEDDDD
jgi:hypothetical protein